MRKFTTYSEAESRAVELGAVKVGVCYPAKNSGAFSAHFFDAAGLEVGYYHYDLHQPLLELTPRRAWHNSFLDGLQFSRIKAAQSAARRGNFDNNEGNIIMNISAFNSNIPQAAQDKILALVTLGADFVNDLGGDSFGDTAKPEPVEWKSRDGFVSYNDGGYAARQMYAAGNSSGIYRSEAEREFTERLEQDAYAAYLRDNDLPPDAELTEEQREVQFEYEMSYMDDQYTIAEFEVFVIRDSQKVQCSMLLHYRDAPYHRSKYAEEVYVKNWPMVEFMELDNATIMADVQKAYDNA